MLLLMGNFQVASKVLFDQEIYDGGKYQYHVPCTVAAAAAVVVFVVVVVVVVVVVAIVSVVVLHN